VPETMGLGRKNMYQLVNLQVKCLHMFHFARTFARTWVKATDSDNRRRL
jgi:hypothetical protein